MELARTSARVPVRKSAPAPGLDTPAAAAARLDVDHPESDMRLEVVHLGRALRSVVDSGRTTTQTHHESRETVDPSALWWRDDRRAGQVAKPASTPPRHHRNARSATTASAPRTVSPYENLTVDAGNKNPHCNTFFTNRVAPESNSRDLDQGSAMRGHRTFCGILV